MGSDTTRLAEQQRNCGWAGVAPGGLLARSGPDTDRKWAFPLTAGWTKENHTAVGHSPFCWEVRAAPLFLVYTAFRQLEFSWVRKIWLLVALQRKSKLHTEGRVSVPSAGQQRLRNTGSNLT